MENIVVRKAILSTVAADGDNVLNVAASGAYPGACIVCVDHAVDPVAELLPPITKGTCSRATKLASQAEVVQMGVIGLDQEVITASTRYKIGIGNLETKYEGHSTLLGVYAYTSPAVLTGNAATDRTNVYTVLNTKINNHSNNNVASYLMYKVAFTTGSSFLPQIGETFTQATSSATAVLAAIVVTSGNFTATTAAGTAYFYSNSGTWVADSKVSTGGTSTAEITTAALQTCEGLVLIDDTGYFPAWPGIRKGVSTIEVTEGFDTAQVDVGERTTDTTLLVAGIGWLRSKVGVYSHGIGSRMLQDVPTWNLEKTQRTSGEPGFVLNAAPDAAKVYTIFRIFVDVSPTDNVLTSYGKAGPFIYELYADESNGTNLTNLEGGLETALGVTIA